VARAPRRARRGPSGDREDQRSLPEARVDVGPYEVWSSQSGLFAASTTSLSRRGGGRAAAPGCRDPSDSATRDREPDGMVLKGGWRTGGDHALPLSDHADFDELIELVERVRPRVVYVTHGSARFARELRQRGFAAEFLRQKPQMRLF